MTMKDDLLTALKELQEASLAMISGLPSIRHLAQEQAKTTHFASGVTAIVGLAGTCNGLVSLHSSQTLALGFTTQMPGMDVSEVGDDVNDALGEIANMI